MPKAYKVASGEQNPGRERDEDAELDYLRKRGPSSLALAPMSAERHYGAAVLLPALAVALFEFIRHQLAHEILPGWLGHGWAGNVLGALVVAGVVYGFVRFFAGVIGRSAAEAARAHREAAVIVERQRIAREMHDGVAQALFYLAVKLREVDGMLPATGADLAREELREAARNLNEAYGQVREAITDLKEQADLEDFGEAVRRAAPHGSQRIGLGVECRVEGEPDLPARSRQHLLAIVQEAVANARRHGKLRTVSVVAKSEPPPFSHPGSGEGGDLRECRGLLQPKEAALLVGIRKSREFRSEYNGGGCFGVATVCPPELGNPRS